MNQPTRPQHNNAASRFTYRHGRPMRYGGNTIGVAEKFRVDGCVTVVAYRARAQIRVTDET